MAPQGAWLPARVRYVWVLSYYLLVVVLVVWLLVVSYASATSGASFAPVAIVSAALVVVIVIAFCLLLRPFQTEVTFLRGHAFYRGRGIRALGPTYVKPWRVVRSGLAVDVRSRIRGFQITFQNASDAATFMEWCRESGVRTEGD